jgi:hypothetical protein
MAAVAPATISVKQMATYAGGAYGPQVLVCGDCGCLVADEHLQTHVAFHAQTAAAAFPKTIVPNVPAGVR